MRKSVQLKSSLDQTEAANQGSADRQPADKNKSLFSITKSNYRLQSSTDTLTIQLSQTWLIKIMTHRLKNVEKPVEYRGVSDEVH